MDRSLMYEKPLLGYEELTDIIDLSLWAGQLLLQYGADSARVEETVHHVGTGLGCNWMDILVSPNALVISTISGTQFRTKLRRVTNMGVNMAVVSEVNDLSRRVFSGEIDRFALRTELRRVSDLKGEYNRWMIVAMVGLACAAFSRLFAGDWPVFFVTLVAASVSMFVRQELARRYFNPLMIAIITSFSAGLIASSATVFQWSDQPQIALAASVLLMVPGVALINAAEDVIQGHLLIGFARGMGGLVTSLGIALGLLLAMGLVGIDGL